MVDPQDVLNGLNLSRPNNSAPFRAREFQEQGGAFVPGGRQSDATRLEPVPFGFNQIPVEQLKPDRNENSGSESAEPQTREQLPAPIRSAPTDSSPRVQPNDPETEVITENYADGKPRLIRTVKMDEDGNYYNHGPWKVLNQSGDVVAQGSYKLGLMDGIWGRRHLASEGGLFATKPFSFYTGPFDSFANFKNGKLHGTWAIYNQNGVGQKVFEIEYRDGKRHGQAVWYYPDQHRYRQATFQQGVLDGDVLEWDSSPDHQLASRDRYFEGRKLVQTTASYRPDAKLSVETYLDQKLIPEGEDNWWAAKPTPFVPQGQRVQEGPVASWYPNQQPKHRGQYKGDHPVGTFYWWHENGNRKSRGSFDSNGQRHGTWIWWHANGMKQFEGEYSHGEPKGLWRSWFEDGQLRKEKNYDAPKLMGADQFDIDTLNDTSDDVDSAKPPANQDDEPEEQGTGQSETEPASAEPGELPVPDQKRETIEPIDAIPFLIDEGSEGVIRTFNNQTRTQQRGSRTRTDRKFIHRIAASNALRLNIEPWFAAGDQR